MSRWILNHLVTIDSKQPCYDGHYRTISCLSAKLTVFETWQNIARLLKWRDFIVYIKYMDIVNEQTSFHKGTWPSCDSHAFAVE
ncbi:hypothetical protein PoB_003014200 [Plakobranchus ocellatus]|uniref:Uncharacterized protein n=1 Tax=Plakobranchus ocellatus TaxID=259542 RepID=A0AAV4A8R6_9GAST|nr:hypothetical protein PoB_003014200 [Plakobranchus ocellatus]